MSDAASSEQSLDLYGLLGVERDATVDQIRKAYRNAARVLHPDIAETGDALKFNQARLARDVLTRPDWRANYDALGIIPADEADNAVAALLEVLTGMFGQTMHSILSAGHEPYKGDFVSAMHEGIKSGFEMTNKAIAQLEKSKAQLVKMAGRFRVRSFEQPNHFETIVTSQIAGLERQIDANRNALRQLESARMYLNDISFDFDRVGRN